MSRTVWSSWNHADDATNHVGRHAKSLSPPVTASAAIGKESHAVTVGIAPSVPTPPSLITGRRLYASLHGNLQYTEASHTRRSDHQKVDHGLND